MAADLGVSPSYLNHIERNQRPVSAQLLLRLADTYDVDLRSLNQAGAADEARLTEILTDPLFKGLSAPRHELVRLLEEAPGVADALLRLYQAFDDGRAKARAAAETGRGPGRIQPRRLGAGIYPVARQPLPRTGPDGRGPGRHPGGRGARPRRRIRAHRPSAPGRPPRPGRPHPARRGDGGMDAPLRPAPPPPAAVGNAGAVVARLRHRLSAGPGRTGSGPASDGRGRRRARRRRPRPAEGRPDQHPGRRRPDALRPPSSARPRTEATIWPASRPGSASATNRRRTD